MNDLSNELDNNFESIENTSEDTLEDIEDNAVNIILNNEVNTTEDSNNEVSETEEIVNTETEDEIVSTADTENSEDFEVSNCLALTVKKDYSLSVVKNVVIRTFKGIWKVAISIFTLNIIKFFF